MPLQVSSPRSSHPGREVGARGSAIVGGQLGDRWAALGSCLPKVLENGFACIIHPGIPPTSNAGGGPHTIRIAALTHRLTVYLVLNSLSLQKKKKEALWGRGAEPTLQV